MLIINNISHQLNSRQPHHHHSSELAQHHQQGPPAGYNGNNISINQKHPQNNLDGPVNSVTGQQQPQRIMPKNHVNNFQPHQYNANHQHHHQQHHHNQAPPTSQVPVSSSSPSQLPPHSHLQQQQQQQQPLPHPHPHQQQPHPAGQMDLLPTQGRQTSVAVNELPIGQTRLTLPLRDAPLMGPFRLEHDAQFTSKVFHIKSQLFEQLSKSMSLMNPQAAIAIQELQFRSYIIKSSSSQGDSLLAPNNNNQQATNQLHQPTKACSWPELFQLSVNQNVIHLDRSKAQHKAIDIFQYCQMGDNMLEIQVNDCYCTHEFVLEAVDRPTLKAFMNSCFKSRLLANEACIQKMKFNFGAPGFLIQSQQLQQTAGIFNEYITEFVQGIEQTRTRISLRCPISARRMRTPTRGYNCKHLQCFDLESFLYLNRERSRWNCPICSSSIPFTMLELDQHQINIVQAMSEILNTDDILIDGTGQWQAYYATSGPQQQQQQQQQTQHQMIQTTAKSTGTYHPQPPPMMNGIGSPAHPHPHPHPQQQHHHHHQQQQQQQQQHQQQPMRPTSGPIVTNRQPLMGGPGSPASWDSPAHNHHPADVPSPIGGPTRRPASAISGATGPTAGRRSANGSPLAKKAYSGHYSQQQQQQQQSPAVSMQQTGSAPSQAQPTSTFFNGLTSSASASSDHHSTNSLSFSNDINTDDLSPLAAMERTIIQHEQQMGPPPFDPNSLTSSSPATSGQQRNTSGSIGNASSSIILHSPSSQPHNMNTPPTASAASGGGSGTAAAAPSTTGIARSPMIQASPNNNVSGAAFSPASHAIPSPAGRLVPASPQQQRVQQQQQQQQQGETVIPPQSPMQQQQQIQSISTPATPSSMLLVHGGPETPATPSNSQQHCGQIMVNHNSPHIPSNSSSTAAGGNGLISGGQTSASGVDHQPLSNGSASAGSITSSSTMTPSGQSLGSVGMGGDSRCGTAPLQGVPLGLDDLMLPGNSTHNIQGSGQYGNNKSMMTGNSPNIDESNEILMGKLLMDSSESILRDHRNGDQLAMALDEVDWKAQHQLDRGKSEHLANFLNEPLMKKQQQQHYQHQQQQQQQHQQQGTNKMLSGGLNPSDDEGNQSHSSSPGHNLDQLELLVLIMLLLLLLL